MTTTEAARRIAGTAPTGAEFEGFVKIDGIPGECLDDKHKDWIELLGFNHDMVQPPSHTQASAGGATTGRTQHSDFRIAKLLDKASPLIYQAVSSGKHVKEVLVEFCRAGGDKLKFFEIKMEEVLISAVCPGGGGGSGFPSEEVAFNYGKIKWTYTQQKRKDGSGGGNTTGGWDLSANKILS